MSASDHTPGAQTTSPAAAETPGQARLMWFFVIVFGVLLTLKYFPGLENEDAYGGLSFQAIHPDAMAGDVFYGPHLGPLESSYKLSVYYLFPKLLGEIWLDDRFIAAVYLLFVIAAIVGVDRIARVLGANGVVERMLVLVLVLKDHDILINKVLLAHHPDFNHSAMAIPLVVWLFYIALARKGLVPVLIVSAVLTAVSVKSAALPVAASLLIVFSTGARTWERRAAGLLFVLAGIAAAAAVLYVLASPAEYRLALWDAVSREFMGPGNILLAVARENWSEAVRYAGFVVLCLACLAWPAKPSPALTGVRIAVALTLVIWAVGNFYVPYAPDFLKQPLILPFSLTSRMHQFPQIVATIALAVMVLRWIEERTTPGRLSTATAVLGVLFFAGPGNFDKWLLALAGTGAVVTAGLFLQWRRDGRPAFETFWTGRRFAAGSGLWLGLALTASLAGTIATQSLPAWKMLAARGVYGLSSTAPWVDVAGYIRANTSKDARVLAFVFDPVKDRLKAVRSLATRTGRTMTATHRGTSQFDIERWQLESKQTALLRRAGAAWMAGDPQTVRDSLAGVVMAPDYIVLPAEYAARIDAADIGFSDEAVIGDFVILKRT